MRALSAIVGGLFGALAGLAYGGKALQLVAGSTLGLVAGLAVGVAWCRLMFRAGHRVQRRGSSGRLVIAPVVGGILAGSTATLVLHLGMQLLFGFKDGLVFHMVGQLFGIVAGLVMGAIGAAVWPPVPRGTPGP